MHQQLSDKYATHILGKMKNSCLSFNQITTPGWSSLVQTENSEASPARNRRNFKPLQQTNEDANGEANTKQTNQSKDNTRFRAISVHEHLHLDSKKIEKKKMIERLIEEEYQKKKTLPFTPYVSAKSHKLAQSKMQKDASKSLRSAEQDTPDLQQNIPLKEPSRYEIIHNVFLVLSDGGELVTSQSIVKQVETLPLPCIRSMDRLLQQLYLGKEYNWLEFLAAFNDKDTIENKKGFFMLMGKWIKRAL